MSDEQMITVEVWDAGGVELTVASLPAEAPVERILVRLVQQLDLPQTNAEGQLISYKLNHHNRTRQLLDQETLDEAGVSDGDVLRLVREILAG